MSDDSEEEEDTTNVPSNLSSLYRIEKIILQQPMRQNPEEPGVSYDGLEDAKQVEIVEPGMERRNFWIATDLTQAEEDLLIATLREFWDVLSWSYKDFKGVDPEICQHTIPM